MESTQKGDISETETRYPKVKLAETATKNLRKIDSQMVEKLNYGLKYNRKRAEPDSSSKHLHKAIHGSITLNKHKQKKNQHLFCLLYHLFFGVEITLKIFKKNLITYQEMPITKTFAHTILNLY